MLQNNHDEVSYQFSSSLQEFVDTEDLIKSQPFPTESSLDSRNLLQGAG